MLLLPLIWLVLGVIVGCMVYLARLQPALWPRFHGLDLFALLLLGAIVSLCSGWFGDLLFGRLFSIATALWITIAGVIILPWGIVRVQKKFKRN